MLSIPKQSHLPLLVSPTNSTRHSFLKTETHKHENIIRHLTQKLNRNLSYLLSNTKHINSNETTLSQIINAIKTDITKRSLEDIAILYNFLSKSSFISKLKEDGIDSSTYNKMLIIIATYASYMHIPNNNIIYDFNQNAIYSYIIIQGEVSLHSPQPEMKHLTGFEYFLMLMEMYDSDNIPIIEYTIKHNALIYNVNIDDIELLKLVLLKIRYRNMNNKYYINESFLEKIHIKPNEIGANFETMSQIAIDDKIKMIIKNIPEHLCKKYAFLNDNTIKNNITVFTFANTQICKEGDFIGCNMNGSSIPNEKDVNIKVYSSKAISNKETHLIAMNNYIYNEFLQTEIANIKTKELSFLYDNFFFTSIPKRRFEREYFPLFTKATLSKHTILHKENDHLHHIYFIIEGNIILISTKSIIETHAMVKILQSYINDAKTLYNETDFPFLMNLPSQMANELKQKQTRKILIHSNKEILGIESLYGGWNYMFTAKVESDMCSVYKISIDNLINIFNKEDSSVYEIFVKRSKIQLEMILKRLLNVNKTSLQIIDRQICPMLNNTDTPSLNTTNTLEQKDNNSNKKFNLKGHNSFHRKKVMSLLSLSQDEVTDYKSKQSMYTKYKNSVSYANSSLSNIRKIGLRNKHIMKILSLNDGANNKHAFEERMLFKVKNDIRLSQKTLISKFDNVSFPNSWSDNNSKENVVTFLTTTNSKSNLQVNKNNSTFSKKKISIEKKTNISMNSTMKHTQVFKTPITKERMKKYEVFDTGLDYFDFSGDYKHFKHKTKMNKHNEVNDYKNKTFKNLNTMSLKKFDENGNRTRYNLRMKQVNVLNSLKQAKNVNYKKMIMTQMYKKMNPIYKK